MGQEAFVETNVDSTDWFNVQKVDRQHCIFSLYTYNLYTVYVLRNKERVMTGK